MTRKDWDELAAIRAKRKAAPKGTRIAWYRAHVRKVAEIMRREIAEKAA